MVTSNFKIQQMHYEMDLKRFRLKDREQAMSSAIEQEEVEDANAAIHKHTLEHCSLT